ncbi:MAG TPA: adenosine deaminase [Acidobacteriaceae bacterium]|jgi:adenosine deaminase|nr:adenosine deaminase [Acidobacteriaceae bacterium]
MVLTRRAWGVSVLVAVCISFVGSFSVAAQARDDAKPTHRTSAERGADPEARAARAFEEAKKQGPAALRAFLYRMPKGADLHSHLGGAVYAETFIREAGEDGLCVNAAQLKMDTEHHGPNCPEGETSARDAPANQHLYDALIDAFSMRTFVPVTGESGHDHFFDTFERFGDNKRFTGEWVDEVAARAAAQNEQYLELMQTPGFKAAAALAYKFGWHDDPARLREQLLGESAFRANVESDRAELAEALKTREAMEHCGHSDAAPACRVTVKFLYQVLRGHPPEQVFAQTLLGFEVASGDSDVVGINFVMPEDGYISMRDYALQMKMLDYLHGRYPQVHIALHAGELSEDMVPPDGLTFHIRSAVEQGHAERIGHGVDVMYEDRPSDLMKEMADRHVMVEVNLTSNDVILNVKGNEHPFMLYRKAGVPVALSTDDEGVSRIDLTHEYVRAADTYPLTYHDLKGMARTGLEHSFLPGASLWERVTPEKLETAVAACRQQLGAETPALACATLVQGSEKAQQEWELEHRLRVFEAGF